MKSVYVSCLTAMILTACSHVHVANDSVQSLPSPDVSLLNELQRVKTIAGDHAWPGFSDAKVRMVLISRESQWSIGIPHPPAEYQNRISSGDLARELQPVFETSSYRDQTGRPHDDLPTTLFNSYSALQTGDHFREPIYFVKTLKEYRNAGDPMDSEEWVHISLHELFHTYQDRFVHYTDEFMQRVTVPYKQAIRNDEQHIKLLQPELNHLAKAACAEDPKAVRQELISALKLRLKRWKWITARYRTDPSNWERYETWAEGTAHYVEHKIMSDWATYSSGSGIADAANFNNFSKYKAEKPSLWCQQIAENKKRSYWYSIGFAYALALDKLSGDWKTQQTDDKLFFDAHFQKLELLGREQ